MFFGAGLTVEGFSFENGYGMQSLAEVTSPKGPRTQIVGF